MDTPLGSVPSPYEGLQVTSAQLFPLTCAGCQRRFPDIKDYIARTTPIFYSSGLVVQRDPPGSDTFVLLVRNCLCGSALALRCKDRRNQSEAGQRRRSRYTLLLALLLEAGVDSAAAQAEVRRLLQTTAA